ncbi:MAG: helix-turn-helix domain-containing protein [Bacilli bacterium]|nr:helix-turn-helix domain-containing protein [Bacilli bacterium]
MNNLAATIGKNIASLRKAKGMTQQDLAEEIHYSDKSISKWELGYSAPSIDILMDIAHFFGVSVDYLLREQTDASILEVAENEEAKKEENNRAISQAIMLAMSMTFCVLVAVCIFFSPFFFDPANGKLVWQAFIWMIPASLLVAIIEVQYFYHNRLARTVLASVFIWALLIAFAVQFAYGNPQGQQESVWFILAVGAPLQVIVILYHNYRRFH